MASQGADAIELQEVTDRSAAFVEAPEESSLLGFHCGLEELGFTRLFDGSLKPPESDPPLPAWFARRAPDGRIEERTVLESREELERILGASFAPGEGYCTRHDVQIIRIDGPLRGGVALDPQKALLWNVRDGSWLSVDAAGSTVPLAMAPFRQSWVDVFAARDQVWVFADGALYSLPISDARNGVGQVRLVSRLWPAGRRCFWLRSNGSLRSDSDLEPRISGAPDGTELVVGSRDGMLATFHPVATGTAAWSVLREPVTLGATSSVACKVEDVALAWLGPGWVGSTHPDQQTAMLSFRDGVESVEEISDSEIKAIQLTENFGIVAGDLAERVYVREVEGWRPLNSEIGFGISVIADYGDGIAYGGGAGTLFELAPGFGRCDDELFILARGAGDVRSLIGLAGGVLLVVGDTDGSMMRVFPTGETACRLRAQGLLSGQTR